MAFADLVDRAGVEGNISALLRISFMREYRHYLNHDDLFQLHARFFLEEIYPKFPQSHGRFRRLKNLAAKHEV